MVRRRTRKLASRPCDRIAFASSDGGWPLWPSNSADESRPSFNLRNCLPGSSAGVSVPRAATIQPAHIAHAARRCTREPQQQQFAGRAGIRERAVAREIAYAEMREPAVEFPWSGSEARGTGPAAARRYPASRRRTPRPARPAGRAGGPWRRTARGSRRIPAGRRSSGIPTGRRRRPCLRSGAAGRYRAPGCSRRRWVRSAERPLRTTAPARARPPPHCRHRWTAVRPSADRVRWSRCRRRRIESTPAAHADPVPTGTCQALTASARRAGAGGREPGPNGRTSSRRCRHSR